MDEPSIEVNKPQEDLDLMIWLWLWPLLNGGYTVLVHGHAIGGHHEPKEFDFGGEEITFLQTWVQLKASIDQDIVQVDHTELIHQPCQQLVDVCLKCGWGICEPKRKGMTKYLKWPYRVQIAVFHLSPFQMLMRVLEVKLGKYLSTGETVQGLSDQG